MASQLASKFGAALRQTAVQVSASAPYDIPRQELATGTRAVRQACSYSEWGWRSAGRLVSVCLCFVADESSACQRCCSRGSIALWQGYAFKYGAAASVVAAVRMFGDAAYLSKEEVTERVLQVVKNFQKVDPAKVSPESHFVNDLGLDSLDTVEVCLPL
eukprot:scaffold304_cov409-Prasinococcus_capsulatus_cf.AAC.17